MTIMVNGAIVTIVLLSSISTTASLANIGNVGVHSTTRSPVSCDCFSLSVISSLSRHFILIDTIQTKIAQTYFHSNNLFCVISLYPTVKTG